MSETIRDEAGDERRAEIRRRMASAPKPRSGPRRYGRPRPFQAKPKPEGYVTGRPTLYRSEHCEVAVDAMAKGHSITGVAGTLRVSVDTVYEWMLRHSEFSEAIKVGKACRVLMLENKLLSTSMGVGVTAAIFALKNAAPDEYRDIIEHETNVNIRIEKIPDARLIEIVASAPLPGNARTAPLPVQLPQAEPSDE